MILPSQQERKTNWSRTYAAPFSRISRRPRISQEQREHNEAVWSWWKRGLISNAEFDELIWKVAGWGVQV